MSYMEQELFELVRTSQNQEFECYAYGIEIINDRVKKVLKPQRGFMRTHYGALSFHVIGKRGAPLAKPMPCYQYTTMRVYPTLEECIESYQEFKSEVTQELQRVSNDFLNMINEL